MKTIAIVDAPEASAVMDMFLKNMFACFTVSEPSMLNWHPYDAVCFVGGEDISPELYNAEKHPKTYNNPYRDKIEKEIYLSIPQERPKIGICRGGQFLNVMNGGSMIQDIKGHTNTTHWIDDLESECYEDYCIVNSDHHQEMVPGIKAKEVALTNGHQREVIWYPDTNSLCFQPHPEWSHKPTHNYFFELLKRFYNFG